MYNRFNTISVMKQAVVFLSVFITLLSCTSKENGDLAAKKKQLEDLKSQHQQIQQQIISLEKEITLMDTSSGTGLKVRLVKVDSLQPQIFEHFVDVQGSIDSEENVMASPEMPGVVTGIMVKEGDVVSKGTVLATMESAAMSNALQEVKTAYALASTAFEKQKRLWDQKIGSEIQFLQAKTNKESLESRIKSMEAQLNMSRIKAPVSGTIDDVRLKLGEMASPGMSGVRVVNMNKMKVVANVSDTYIANIKKGDVVKVELPDVSLVLDAKVTFVAKVINPQNRSFKVEVALPNKDNLIRPNMVAKIKINDEKKDDVLVISSNLVKRTGNEKFIMVAEKENNVWVAKKRTITTGNEYNGKTIVMSGLSKGDMIITAGQNDVVEGQSVKF
jgi:membrane fusion protein (multidrug efflux system)